ncbi:MAG: hypothetical protein JSU67_04560, partial [Gammaproteobacteria bacterium]
EMLKGVAPVANPGLDQTAIEGNEVVLDGSLSSDPDNEIVAYQWMQTGGPLVNIAGNDMGIATFLAPLVDSDQVLSFELTVIDELGNRAMASVDVNVTDFSSTELGVVLSSSSIGPLTVGEILTLSAQAAGGTGGTYEYQFRYKSLDGDGAPWIVLKGFDSINSIDWDTAALGGKYRLQVRAREVGNEAVVARDSRRLWVNSVAPLSNVILTSDTVGPQLEGNVALLSASVALESAAIEYRFEIKNTDIQPGWMLIRDYGVSGDLAWNSSGYRGKNKVRVSARKAGTRDLAVSDTVTIWVNSSDAVTSVQLTPSLFSPQLSGTGVTFDAGITGGNGSVEYRFSVKDT